MYITSTLVGGYIEDVYSKIESKKKMGARTRFCQ